MLRAAVLLIVGAVLGTTAIYFLRGGPYDPLGGLVLVQNDDPGPPLPAEPVNVPESNLIGRQAQAWGVANCLGAIADVAAHLTQNTQYSYRLFRNESDTNRQMITATIAAREPTSGTAGLSSFQTAPRYDGRCNVAMQTTIFYAAPCGQVKEARFPNFAQIAFGDVAAAFAAPEGNTSLYLLPAGEAGCVALTTETIY